MQAYAHRDRRGHTGWTLVDGRAPASPGEIALTAQTARRLGRGIGDTVGAVDTRGAPVALTIVGLGIGPNNSNERLDELALVTSDDIARLGVSQAFTEALVSVAPGVDVGDVIASYADRYELTEPSMPADVANIAELGSLPEALGAFLAVIAVVALLHLLATTVSRRADDLAVLRALGATRTEIRRVVVVAAVSVALVGLVAGVPLGLALGRLVWWSVAHSIGVASDASYLAGPFAVIVPVVLAASVVVAWIPARRAMRLSLRAVE
jgi:ABC-type antimicrobial peptide transport system permease subunit